MNKKGIVLLMTMMVMSVLLVLIGAYFSSIMTEKKAADNEEFVLQALTLAEAGSSHAHSELRERIRTDLNAMVETEHMASTFQVYVTNNDSLGFLHDYAYAAGDPQFTVAGGEATLAVSPLNLGTGIQGTYAANIIVTPNGNPTSVPGEDRFIFPYKYTIESTGSMTRPTYNITRNTRLLQGTFSVTVYNPTFAKFALFTAHHRTPGGGTVWFTENTNFTGPVHTNERFSFANSPSAHFSEEVTQHETRARFYNDGSPVLMNADSNPPNDVPTFDGGFQRGVDLINLESALSQADLKREALGDTSEPGSNGIYVPNDGINVVGGIYIRGNQGQGSDDSIISMTAGANGPVYTITQDTTTKTITVDYTNNQTTVQEGENQVTYTGIPDGETDEGIIIYANDAIQSLSGTVEQASTVTLSAEKDIVITNHIQYQDFTPDDPGTPLVNELSAEGFDNLLGVISWGGDVRIGLGAPNDVNIHGIVMAHSGVFKVDSHDEGSPRGVATLLGGVITDFYGPFGTFSGATPISGYGRNFVYDARMMQGMAPPYFPYMGYFTSVDDNALDDKLVWQDQGV